MTKDMLALPKHQQGFTLIETIIYVGLFGLLFTGILTTVVPLISGSDRLSGKIAVEGEVAFILHKIEYAVAETVTTPASVSDISPHPGNTEHSLTLGTGASQIQFEHLSGSTELTYRKGSGTAIPLNAERVEITDFSVTHSPAGSDPHFLEITMNVRHKGDTISQTVGPVRYHLHF